MSSYSVQQIDIETVLQLERTVYMRAELLNKSFLTIENVEGVVYDDDYTIDTNSDSRRMYKVIMVVTDSTFNIGRDKKIWLDKYIRLSVGIRNLHSHEIRWYPMGIFIFNSADYSFDPVTKLLNLSCSDRVSELNGERNGQLSGITTAIPVRYEIEPGLLINNTVRGAMVNTVAQLGGIQKYRIEDSGEFIPYDLAFGTGSYVWDIVKTLRDLSPGWEAFFDNEHFVCQPIPTYESDPVVIDADMVDMLSSSINISINFSNVRNITEVWGKCLDADFYTETSSTDASGAYLLNYSSISELSTGLKVAFKAPENNKAKIKLKINNFSEYPLLCEGNVAVPANKMQAGKSYVVRFVNLGDNSYFYYMGQWQIVAITKLVSKYPDAEKIAHDLLNEPTDNISYIVQDSPFCSDYPDVGEIRQVLSGGEYDNIYSEDLALQRAEYENWISTDLKDTITLSAIDVPWLDVNQKIECRSPITGEVGTYIIKTKQGSSTKGTMTLSCVKFQPLYPWLT